MEKINVILFVKNKGDLTSLLWFINTKNMAWITYKMTFYICRHFLKSYFF